MAYRILIVDDEKDCLDATKILLESQDYTVFTLSKAVELYDRLVSLQPIDLIVLDLDMPGMSGADVLHRFKEYLTLRNIPIIVYSGAADKGMFDLVFSALQCKPYKMIDKGNPEELLHSVGSALMVFENRRHLSSKQREELFELERHFLEKNIHSTGKDVEEVFHDQMKNPKYLRYLELKLLDEGDTVQAEMYADKRKSLIQ